MGFQQQVWIKKWNILRGFLNFRGGKSSVINADEIFGGNVRRKITEFAFKSLLTGENDTGNEKNYNQALVSPSWFKIWSVDLFLV